MKVNDEISPFPAQVERLATPRPLGTLIGILQGAEIELAEQDGYDLCRPLGIRVAINSLLVGLGVEPKDLAGEVATATDPTVVYFGKEISRAVNEYEDNKAKIEALTRHLRRLLSATDQYGTKDYGEDFWESYADTAAEKGLLSDDIRREVWAAAAALIESSTKES